MKKIYLLFLFVTMTLVVMNVHAIPPVEEIGKDGCAELGEDFYWDETYGEKGACIHKSQSKAGNYTPPLSTKVNCGNITDIPRKIPEITSYIVSVLQVAVPVILIILGSIDLAKGILASKEDEIKSGQRMFIKRLIMGVLVFFLVIIIKLIISIVDNKFNSTNISSCIDCFINYDCKSSVGS